MTIIHLTSWQYHPGDYQPTKKDFGFFATREAADRRVAEYMAEIEQEKQRCEKSTGIFGGDFWKRFYCIDENGMPPIFYTNVFVTE